MTKKEPKFPALTKAADTMARCNGGINRYRSEQDFLDDLASVLMHAPHDLDAIDKWLATRTDPANAISGDDMPSADREFLFSYRFGGKEWGTSVFADSPAEAMEKIKAVALARYDGELQMRIPAAVPGARWFVRALTWWKNQKS